MIVHGRLLADPTRPADAGWIEIDGGRITAVGHGAPPRVPDLGDAGAIVCPGFIDAHVHLPQIDAVGHDGLPLLEWLDRIVYPAECRWADPRFAAEQAIAAHRRMLAAGTLGYAGYLTAHEHAPDTLDAAVAAVPLRAAAGQVLMDRAAPASLLGRPVAPPAPRDGRREGTVNPRFGVACTDTLLRRAADLAGGDRIVQTHLAETRAECDAVARLFPDDPGYTAVYDRRGLLGPRTLLAHGLHLDDAAWTLIAERGSVVVHCPVANTFLRAGVFDLAATRRHGVRLALGSDVAAGCDLAMPRVARAMIEVAKLRQMTIDPDAHVPTPAEAWSLITAGNADALGWTDAGRIEVGVAADLLVLDAPFAPDHDLVARLLYNWTDAFIRTRVVGGERF